MQIILLILFGFLALLALSIIVLVHEFGHFIVAKKSGILVEEFGLGLPPRIWGKKWGETLYSINALPIGGFVRLHGETLEDKVTNPKRAFSNKSGKVRIAVSLAGIVMNFVLAAVIFSIVYSITGIVQEGGNIKITNISSGSPAQVVGLLVGDTIKKVANTEITNNEQFVNLINENKGKKVQLEVEREVDGKAELKKFSVTPRENPPEGEGALGVTIAFEPIIFYPPLLQRPLYGVYYGVRDTIDFTKSVILGFGQITRDVSSGRAPEGVVGPLGIIAVIIDFFRRGILEGAVFMGIISLNLAIFNLIPFPPLDGSRVMFVIIEKLFGKKILPRVESIAHSIGMVILLLMLIAISGREIPRLIRSGSISGFVDTLIK